MAFLDPMVPSFTDEMTKIAEEKKHEEGAWKKFTRFTTSPAGRISGLAMQGASLGGKTIPMIKDLIKGKGWDAADAISGKGALIGAALGAGAGYLLRNTDPLFGVRPKEKTAGVISALGGLAGKAFMKPTAALGIGGAAIGAAGGAIAGGPGNRLGGALGGAALGGSVGLGAGALGAGKALQTTAGNALLRARGQVGQAVNSVQGSRDVIRGVMSNTSAAGFPKMAGVFATAGKAVGSVTKRIANAGRALAGKSPKFNGVGIGNSPEGLKGLTKGPRMGIVDHAKEMGKKGLMGAGLIGIGAAGHAALSGPKNQNQGMYEQ